MIKSITLLALCLLIIAVTQRAGAQELESKTGADGLSGFVEKSSGKVVIPLIYDYVSLFSEGIVAVRNTEMKWGILNKKGETLVPFRLEYDYIDICLDGLLFVRDKDNWRKFGYINKSGKLVIPMVYEETYGFKDGKAIVKKDGRYYRINKKNKIIEALSEEEVKEEEPFWWVPVVIPASFRKNDD